MQVVDATALEVPQPRDYGTQLREWHHGRSESRDLARHASEEGCNPIESTVCVALDSTCSPWPTTLPGADVHNPIISPSLWRCRSLCSPLPSQMLHSYAGMLLSSSRGVHVLRGLYPSSCPDRDPRMREILGGRKVVPEADAMTEASRLDGKRN